MEYVDKKKKAVKKTAHPINAAPTFTTASTPDTSSDWNGQDELRTTEPELLEFVNTKWPFTLHLLEDVGSCSPQGRYQKLQDT